MDQNDKALGRAMTAGAALTALAAALALLEGKGPRPVTALGRWLRDMSLSGAGGDALAWLVLRFLGALADAPRERLAAALGVLLTACGAFMALAAAWNGFAQWQAGAEAVRAANTGARETAERTVAVQGLLALLELLPSLLGAAALLWGGRLAGRMGTDPFGEEVLALCGRTAGLCRRAAGAAALLELLAGLVQLLLFRSLASTSFHLRLSLTPLAVTAALYLLCQWFQQGRALKADNDSII